MGVSAFVHFSMDDTQSIIALIPHSVSVLLCIRRCIRDHSFVLQPIVTRFLYSSNCSCIAAFNPGVGISGISQSPTTPPPSCFLDAWLIHWAFRRCSPGRTIGLPFMLKLALVATVTSSRFQNLQIFFPFPLSCLERDLPRHFSCLNLHWSLLQLPVVFHLTQYPFGI